MAQDMTSTEAAQTVSTSARTPIEKEILKIEKKLREVEKLTQRIEAGEALDALQSQKLTKEDELRTALEGFKEQRQLEIEAAAAQEISRKDPSPAEDAASGMGKDDESNERPAPGLTMQGTPARKMFDARCFEGDWLDNFDQRLIVRCGHSRRSRTGGMITYSYMATVRKIGMPDTYLTIQFDADKKDWRCGNGVVDREASSWDDLHWTSTTGRMTRWTRAPPDVAIFFDAPPGGYEQQYLPAEYGGVLSEVDGATYFDGAAWQGEEAWMQGHGQHHQMFALCRWMHRTALGRQCMIRLTRCTLSEKRILILALKLPILAWPCLFLSPPVRCMFLPTDWIGLFLTLGANCELYQHRAM